MPSPAAASPSYLMLRGGVYWLKLAIPRPLRHLYRTAKGTPRTHIRESLGTSSLKDAHRLKLAPLAAWLDQFHRQQDELAGRLPPTIREAAGWRRDLRDVGDDDDRRAAIEGLAVDRAEEIERTAGYTEAKRFYDLATSPTSLAEAWRSYMAESEHNASTKVKDEQAFRSLLSWLGVEDIAPSGITSAVAREYVKWLNEEAPNVRGGKLSYASKLARISPLRSFWSEWLVHREMAATNPWTDPKVRGKRKSTDDQTDKKRPYTDAELLALMQGPELAQRGDLRYTRRLLLEVTALCLYTGVRISELANRTLGDVEPLRRGVEVAPFGYMLHIRKGKRDDSIRSIPIVHPDAVALLRTRIGERTNPAEQLFPEFIPGGPEDSLAWYVSKALGRYRDKVGLGTATDTHSTRRTFISRLIAAGLPLTLVQHYVGHRPPGVTAGVYSTPETAGLLKVAEAVRYPVPIEAAMRTALGLL